MIVLLEFFMELDSYCKIWDYKRNINKNNIPFTQAQLRKNTEKYMTELERNEEKVANFFKHPSIAYAA